MKWIVIGVAIALFCRADVVRGLPLQSVSQESKVFAPVTESLESTRPEQKATGYFSQKEHFYMPPAPRQQPALVPGQRFFCLLNSETLALTNEEGKPVPRAEIALKLLVLRNVEPTRLVFTSEDGSKTYLLPRAAPLLDPASLAGGIYPVLEDSEVEAIREKYEGKSVWAYTGFGLTAIMPVPGISVAVAYNNGVKPAKVSRVLRLRNPVVASLSAGGRGGYMGDSEYDFSAYDPLIVLVETTGNIGATSAWVTGAASPEARKMLDEPRKHALCFYAVFAGAWDMERKMSLISKEQASRSWSPSFREAVQNGQLRKGMTPDMVAWSRGWSSLYGTKEEMRRKSTWIYGDMPPHDVRVFFKNGRVTRWTEPAHLP